jgi:hypothetical protein
VHTYYTHSTRLPACLPGEGNKESLTLGANQQRNSVRCRLNGLEHDVFLCQKNLRPFPPRGSPEHFPVSALGPPFNRCVAKQGHTSIHSVAVQVSGSRRALAVHQAESHEPWSKAHRCICVIYIVARKTCQPLCTIGPHAAVVHFPKLPVVTCGDEHVFMNVGSPLACPLYFWRKPPAWLSPSATRRQAM